jgi:NAD(P)-dependent dehydrogenase (short-subunit alcohol dehydrogenase family)
MTGATPTDVGPAGGTVAAFARYPSLQDRVVLITGGASGIGAEHVAQFARQGARVAFLDLADAEAGSLVDSLRAEGLDAPLYLHCDLTDVAALKTCIETVAARLGPVSVLVNNAANDQRHDWRDVTPAYWDERMATNLRHQFFAIQAVAPGMQAAGGGSIVNFGSISWHTLQGGMPAYTTAKAAIEGLTKGMARDLGPSGIRVNCVIPGWIMTRRQIELWLTPEAEANLLRSQCLKTKLLPEDVTRMVLWLAADDSRMCTGQLWVVDAGRI